MCALSNGYIVYTYILSSFKGSSPNVDFYNVYTIIHSKTCMCSFTFVCVYNGTCELPSYRYLKQELTMQTSFCTCKANVGEYLPQLCQFCSVPYKPPTPHFSIDLLTFSSVWMSYKWYIQGDHLLRVHFALVVATIKPGFIDLKVVLSWQCCLGNCVSNIGFCRIIFRQDNVSSAM